MHLTALMYSHRGSIGCGRALVWVQQVATVATGLMHTAQARVTFNSVCSRGTSEHMNAPNMRPACGVLHADG